MGLPLWLSGGKPARGAGDAGRQRFDHCIRKIPWRRKWLPTAVLLPGRSHGQRSPAGYSPWGCKELDMTVCTHVCAHAHTHTPYINHLDQFAGVQLRGASTLMCSRHPELLLSCKTESLCPSSSHSLPATSLLLPSPWQPLLYFLFL